MTGLIHYDWPRGTVTGWHQDHITLDLIEDEDAGVTRAYLEIAGSDDNSAQSVLDLNDIKRLRRVFQQAERLLTAEASA